MDIGIVNDLLACRACLATDTKLIGIHEFQLDSSFEIVFGSGVSENDSFPQFLCHYCCSLLFKCEAYINRFRRSQEVLTSILLENQTMDTDDLRNLDRDALELSIPLAIQKQPESSILKSVHVSPIRLNLSKLPRIKIIPHGMESTTELGENDRTYMVESGDQVFQVVDIGQQDQIITSDAEDDPQSNDSAQVKDKPKDKYKNISLHPNVDMLVLTLEEQLEEIAGKQSSVGYVSAFLKCEFCYKGFLKEKSYNAHMAMHDPANGPFECPVCKIRCESKQKMRLHSRMAHERRYICKLCGHVDAQPASARAHQQWHDGIRHECHVCTQTFTKSSALSTHLRLHHTGPPCASCGSPMVDGQLEGDTCHHCKQEMTPEEDRYCEDCQMQFDTVEAYNTHINTSAVHSKTDSNLWEHCKQCGESFESLERLEAHCKASHTTGFRCTQCKLTLTSAKGLQIHTGQCHRSKGDVAHIDYPSRKYICQFCGVELDSLEGLTKHKESHSGEKPFLCVHCNRSFRHPQLLQVHMRIHTGETPYQCPRCFRCFKHKANLNRHSKVHTGEKPYTCDVCLKSFTQSNSLKLHVRTVHLKLPAPYRRRRRDNRREDISDDQ